MIKNIDSISNHFNLLHKCFHASLPLCAFSPARPIYLQHEFVGWSLDQGRSGGTCWWNVSHNGLLLAPAFVDHRLSIPPKSMKKGVHKFHRNLYHIPMDELLHWNLAHENKQERIVPECSNALYAGWTATILWSNIASYHQGSRSMCWHMVVQNTIHHHVHRGRRHFRWATNCVDAIHPG